MLKNLFDTESSRTQTKRPVFELHHAPLLEQLDVRPALRVARLSGALACAPPRAPFRAQTPSPKHSAPTWAQVSRETFVDFCILCGCDCE